METKINTVKKSLVGLIFSFFLIFIDQITKILAIQQLKDDNAFVLIDGVFELRYLENRGAAFGILQGKKIFFILFTLIALCLIAYIYLKRIPAERKFRFLMSSAFYFFPVQLVIL